VELILLEKISKLGNIGEVVKVKDGFARNYLLPNKIAIRASDENRKQFDEQREKFEKANDEKKKAAELTLSKLPKNISIYREASEQGALFGSVTSRDLIKVLKEKNSIELNAKDLVLKQNIKNLGEFNAEVILHPEVLGNLQVLVKSIDENKK
jgi:large subunit ribosomal protein L9